MCSVLSTIVCRFALDLVIVLFVLRFTASNYPFGVLDYFFSVLKRLGDDFQESHYEVAQRVTRSFCLVSALNCLAHIITFKLVVNLTTDRLTNTCKPRGGWDLINRLTCNPTTSLCLSQAMLMILSVTCRGLLNVQRLFSVFQISFYVYTS